MEQFTLGFIIGSGLFTFLWFLLNWAGVPYNLASGLFLLVSLIVFDALFKKYFIKERPANKKLFDIAFFRKLNWPEKFFLTVIVFLCLSAFIQTIYWPIRYWDSLALYDFRAKVFAQTGFMQAAIARGWFFGYPLMTSLVHTWVYLSGATNPSFFYALLYIFLLILFYKNIRKLKIGITFSLFFTAVAAVSPRIFDHTQWAYTNLPYSIYIILGSIYLYWGIKNKEAGSFMVSAILIGLSAWTRTAEPFWLGCVAMAVVFSLIAKKWLWPVIYTTIVAVIMLPWRIFEAIYGGGNANVANQVASTSVGVVQNLRMDILKPAFGYFMTNVVNIYLAYFLLLVLIIIAKFFVKSKNWFFTLLTLADLGLTFAGVMIFVRYLPYWQEIPDSLSRMVMFIPVLVVFMAAELVSEYKISKDFTSS